VYDVCTALKSLAFLDGDDGKHPAPVLVFNDGDLIKSQQDIIVSCTSRPIAFPVVDFSSWPIGIQEEMSNLDLKQLLSILQRLCFVFLNALFIKCFFFFHRTHIQTLRFWTTGIWIHEALEPYETIMHIDADTCFKKRQPFLPNFQYFDLVYSSQYISPIAKSRENAMGIYEFAQDFLKERYAANPLWWDYAKTSIDNHRNLPAFASGLEIARKSFMLQPSVVAWHESMTETEPFGLIRNLWGLGVVRFMTMVMFAPNDMVRIRSSVDGFEQMTCSKDDVEKALSSLKKL